MNTLYYGDNLDILRRYVRDESVDLVYLDPPFNSNASYNVLFGGRGGAMSAAQIKAFDDTWHWDDEVALAYNATVETGDGAGQALKAFKPLLGNGDMMAYLVMMAARLVELRRVLKPTGSIYLHCDPTASHYLKVLMDAIFGPVRFMNHIVWQRSDTHNDAKKQFPYTSDHILVYARGDKPTFNVQHVAHADKTLRDWYQYLELSDGTVRRMTRDEISSQAVPEGARRFNAADMASPNPRPNLMYEYKGYPFPVKGWRYSRETMEKLDSEGRLLLPAEPTGRIMLKRYLDEQAGAVLGDVWADISQLRGTTAERMGYPTQKPLALLERIIQASSNPGDMVLDPFCGCGTTVAAAQKLDRQWIGIDITHLAIGLMRQRLKTMFEGAAKFQVIGEPTTTEDATELAATDPYQFQWWALGLVGARPVDQKKGADKGIDGRLYFHDEGPNGPTRTVIISVKAGQNIHSNMVDELRGVVRKEDATIGVLITLKPPTRNMIENAADGDFYTSPWDGRSYPRIQLLTVAELLDGRSIQYPSPRHTNVTHQRAPRALGAPGNQGRLEL